MSVTENSQVDENFETARLVARIADDFRGKDILLLDMRPITPIVDFFIVVTATSQRQMKALGEEVARVMKKRGQQRLGEEGTDGDGVWVLQDFGDVVLHVFTSEGRELYDLEGLWADAPRVGLELSQNPAVVTDLSTTAESADEPSE
ncbi:MAG: ribosome silencing factor [Planctomycetaceae bacterium]|jgi:ribosome-associated protein|nr:ribosome silencing factor [Planctomycetaceae bacterium]